MSRHKNENAPSKKNIFNGRQYLIKEPVFLCHVSLRCLFHCFKIFAMLRQLWPWPFFTRFDHFIPHNGKLRAKRKKSRLAFVVGVLTEIFYKSRGIVELCLGALPKLLKFIYSEKATKFCKIFTLLLTGTT